MLAMVGARNASAAAKRMTSLLAEELSHLGLVIVSGLARGVDGTAHQAALAGGTVAVIGNGAAHAYPKDNADLQAAIIEQGLLLAENPPDTAPQASLFPRRNRIIAGLSLGVVVVEAARRSGSLITARLAGEQGREVFAVPGSPLDVRCHGSNNLLREGAVLTENADDVMQVLRPLIDARRLEAGERKAPAAPAAPPQLQEADRRAVIDLLGPVPISIDELIAQSDAGSAGASGAVGARIGGPAGAGTGRPHRLVFLTAASGRFDRPPDFDHMMRPTAARRREMEVVIVESPAKAKTINKYLGKDYTVLASFGHVRDLPEKNGSVDPDNDFAMSWEEQGDARKRLKDIADAVKKADSLVLATDPDREGEAISWHVLEVLRKKKVLGDKPVSRVVFNAITKNAVLEAMAKPRQIDEKLVDAYLARRALDYLVGFNLSPVLWRKLPGSRSAGRVQSVALRLICERELEIDQFVPREYWSVDTDFKTAKGDTLPTRWSSTKARSWTSFRWAMKTRPARPKPPLPTPLSRSTRSKASRASASRPRRSPPRRCSRKRAASSASTPSAPCRWHSFCIRA